MFGTSFSFSIIHFETQKLLKSIIEALLWIFVPFQLVKNSMPPNFYARYNNKGQTAKQVFISTHGELVKEGRKWLAKTSDSYSVVAALVATVAFTTSTSIPGGSNQESGTPLLNGQLAFKVLLHFSFMRNEISTKTIVAYCN